MSKEAAQPPFQLDSKHHEGKTGARFPKPSAAKLARSVVKHPILAFEALLAIGGGSYGIYEGVCLLQESNDRPTVSQPVSPAFTDNLRGDNSLVPDTKANKPKPGEVFDNKAERILISKEITFPITTEEELRQIPDTDRQGRPIFFIPLGGDLSNVELVKEGPGMNSLRSIQPNTPLIMPHDGYAAAFRTEIDGKNVTGAVAITFMGDDGILYYHILSTSSEKNDPDSITVLDSIPSIPKAKKGGEYYDYREGLPVERGTVLGKTSKKIKDLTVGLKGGLNGTLDGPEGNAVVDILFSTTQDGKLHIVQPQLNNH